MCVEHIRTLFVIFIWRRGVCSLAASKLEPLLPEIIYFLFFSTYVYWGGHSIHVMRYRDNSNYEITFKHHVYFNEENMIVLHTHRCIHTDTYTYIHIYTHTRTLTYIYMCVCVCVCVCVIFISFEPETRIALLMMLFMPALKINLSSTGIS